VADDVPTVMTARLLALCPTGALARRSFVSNLIPSPLAEMSTLMLPLDEPPHSIVVPPGLSVSGTVHL
jgi:hypothetical protein